MTSKLLMSAIFLAAGCAALVPAMADPPFEADPVIRAEAAAPADRFALNLFRELAAEKEQKGNITLSPASLEAVLHLLREGAAGQTRASLDALPLGRQGVRSAMRVQSANALFVEETLKLRTLPADIHRTTFATKPDKAVREVNDWGREKTHGLVPEIAKPGDFTPDTRLVALNAVYLKETWLRPFDKVRTQDGEFTTADGAQRMVPLMRQKTNLRYAEGKDWQAVALFYRRDGRPGEPGCFIGILPKGDARAFAQKLTPERFDAIRRALAGCKTQKTIIALPKMDVDSGIISLKEPLMRLGLADLFSPGADFSAFFESPAVAEDIYLSEVKQRCRVIVSEKETEAAAVTMANMRKSAPLPLRPPAEILFTRPFIWVIGDLTTDAPPYFIGLCEEPQKR